MKNWLAAITNNPKTAIAGVIMAVITLLDTFGIVKLTPEQIASIMGLLTAAGFLIAKDGDVHGGPTPVGTDQEKKQLIKAMVTAKEEEVVAAKADVAAAKGELAGVKEDLKKL